MRKKRVAPRVMYDGLGGQGLCRVMAHRYAVTHGCIYVHIPFARMSHPDKGYNQNTWALECEKFIGFGKGEETGRYDYRIVPPWCSGKRVIRTRGDYGPEARAWARGKWLDAGCPGPATGTVVVAVRTGDIWARYKRNKKDRYGKRFRHPIYMRRRLEAVLKVYKPSRIVVIASGPRGITNGLGDMADEVIVGERCGRTLESFGLMAECDILVGSVSGFSWLAAVVGRCIPVLDGGMFGGLNPKKRGWTEELKNRLDEHKK